MMLTLMFSILHTVAQNSGNCVKHMVHIFSQELFTVTCQTINVSEFREIVFVFSLNNLLSQKRRLCSSHLWSYKMMITLKRFCNVFWTQRTIANLRYDLSGPLRLWSFIHNFSGDFAVLFCLKTLMSGLKRRWSLLKGFLYPSKMISKWS